MRKTSSRDGYVLLLTVLVVGSVASAASAAIILLGLGIERTSFSMQLSSQAMNSAWTCMENAIATLQADLDYEGNHDRSFVYGYDDGDGGIAYDLATCRIYPIDGTNNEDRTICAEGTFGDFTTRRFEAHLSRVMPSAVVDWWDEVDSITRCNPFTGLPPDDCGNGLIQEGLSETCDDGNTFNNDGCSSVCQLEACGDAIRQTGEECDDGNIVPGDGCNDICESEICGDWIQSTGEECEDGNTTNDDGCSSVCRTEFCGDALIQSGEVCDDGGACSGGENDGDPCSSVSGCPSGTCEPQAGDGCDASCQVEDPGSVPPTDYIAYWRLDETDPGSTVVDSSLHGYDGTPEYDAGVSTSNLPPLSFANTASRTFDGWKDDIKYSTSNDLFPSQMTVSFWTKNSSNPGWYDGPICKANMWHDDGWGFHYNPWTDKFEFFIESREASASINPLQWNHVAGTYDGNTIRIYVNGVEGTSDTYSGSVDRGERLRIGRCNSNSDTINGLVDDVRIYDRVLSTEEIGTLAAGN